MAKIIWYGLIWFKTSQKPKILQARLEPHSGCLSLREQKHISVNVWRNLNYNHKISCEDLVHAGYENYDCTSFAYDNPWSATTYRE